MKPFVAPILLTLLAFGCAGPKHATVTPEVPSSKKVVNLEGDVADFVAGAVHGADAANDAQAPGPATDTVRNELGLAKKGLNDPSPAAIKAADARVLAGLAGDRDKYKELAGKFGAEINDLKKELEEAKSKRDKEVGEAQAALAEARKTILVTRLSFVAAALSGVGSVLLALGIWTGLGWKPGAALLGCGLLLGGSVFLLDSPFLYAAATLVLLGLAYGAWTTFQDARKHKSQQEELALAKGTLQRVVAAVDGQKLPEKDPLLVGLSGAMDRVHKDFVNAIRGHKRVDAITSPTQS
jgi:hypothetical protein